MGVSQIFFYYKGFLIVKKVTKHWFKLTMSLAFVISVTQNINLSKFFSL